ncbi:MAG: alpha/beta hydrolase [Myxococcales bacterium]|nr:alpha/beta hydrolase [Myxococcales bacterium]
MVEGTEVDGRKVSFRRESGDTPTLVCIHGSADNHHAYDRLFAELTDVARIAVDSPGRLGTEGPPLDNVSALAAFVSGFVEAEVKGDYIVVGHSVGGAVAIEHALMGSSERLKGVVLLATGARLRVHPAILHLFERLTATRTPPDPTPGLFQPGADPALIAEVTEVLHMTPPATGLADWTASNAFDRMQEVTNIAVPALIIAGTVDALTPPKYAEYLHAHIPRSKLLVLEGAGHMFPIERAAEVAEAIRGFLSEQPDPG